LAQKEFYQKGGKNMLLRRRSDKIDLLKKVPLFSNLTQRDLGKISKHVDQVQVERERVLAQEGKIGWEFIFVVNGKARVEKKGKLIRQLSRGDFFGEISLIDGEPRTATVIAETDMTIWTVHKRSFDHLLDTIPGLQKKMLVSLCKYLRRAEKAAD
jgi:CRP/FNR family cyclic AMP-dependent transcriptional regulator